MLRWSRPLTVAALLSSMVSSISPIASSQPAPAGSGSAGVAWRSAPPPPPPTDEQLRAYEKLKSEAADYEKGAKAFRESVTTIVKHHYEERRRRVLKGLDKEISIEKASLREAREEAIKRLTAFIEKYSGTNALPDHTPDAMFRLAALIEERARTDAPPEQTATNLRPAIDLYKRIIREFPQYREKAAVFYYLGHALNDSSRLPEAQQVWRSLVCNNKYPYPVSTDSTDSDKDIIEKKPQDHDPEYWVVWQGMHSKPLDRERAEKPKKPVAKPAAKPKDKPKEKPKDKPKDPKAKKPKKPDDKGRPAQTEEPQSEDEETTYVNIYPDDCTPIPQKVAVDAEPRYLAEVWYQIGEHHFDYLDFRGGPYNPNRAVTAYRNSLKVTKDKSHSVLYLVAMYKLAWAYFKQQRYEAAVNQFVDMLKFTDEFEKATGSASFEFRREATVYVAGSLIFEDYKGGPEEDPYVFRDDILDKYQNPAVQEKEMHRGVDRVQDAKIVPQDQKWTIDIYRALAHEYQEMNQLGNKTEILELILAKWPMNRDAPTTLDELARTYDERAKYAKEGSPEHDIYAEKALKARSGLINYVGNTPWVDANRDDPEAIQNAERLVKGGLRQAAVEHTLRAQAFKSNGQQTTDAGERKMQFQRSLDEYKLAEQGWFGYIEQDRNSMDVYESKFWLADARHWQVVLMVALEKPVSEEMYTNAKAAAVDVRDSNDDDRFLEPAGQYVVSIAEKAMEEQNKLFKSSNGSQGFEKRTELKMSGKGTDLKVDTAPLPPQVANAVAARDEYIGRVPTQNDPLGNRARYEFQSADFFFLYGQFDDAEKRFQAIYKGQCTDEAKAKVRADSTNKVPNYGFLAWQKLQTMANIKADQTGDTTQSRALAEAEKDPKTKCAVRDEEAAIAEGIVNPTIQGGYYKDAAAAFKKAQEMPDGPDRVKQWRVAGTLYENALKAAPDRDEAPEAAINGAFAYKQIGDYDKAIEMYHLFIEKYGDEKILAKLEKGDADEKKKYTERVKYLNDAYTALSEAYVLFFNYRAAAETSDQISKIDRFDTQKRKLAAYNALVLYSNLGDREKMKAARDKYYSFKPTLEEKAEIDFVFALADYKLWDERGGDQGTNASARQKATTAMSSYYDTYKSKKEANRYVVSAAYYVAKMATAGGSATKGDEWRGNTVSAFTRYRSSATVKDGKNPALGSPEADMAAECDYALLDKEIKAKFDYDTNHHRFSGTVPEVIKKYKADAKEAEAYYQKLKKLTDPANYASAEYLVAAYARMGSLYDSLRTGLFNTKEPALKLFSPQEENTLKQLEESGNDDLIDKALVFRDNRVKLWRDTRDKELQDADNIMIREYTRAVTVAKKLSVRSVPVNKALQRLAFFTDLLGDAKMKQYTSGVDDFVYTDGMFQKMRPGMVADPDPSALPGPLPVVVQ